jgi:hypothetical protein
MQQPQTLNPFVYVENRITIRVDPSGRCSTLVEFSPCDCLFIAPECGPGFWQLVRSHKFQATTYFTPLEWEYPSPTNEEHMEFTDVKLSWTEERVMIRVHPKFWILAKDAGGGRLSERGNLGEPGYIHKGAVLRYHGQEIFRDRRTGMGPVRALWTVAMRKTFIDTTPLKMGDRLCIPELRSRTPYHGTFRLEDTGDSGDDYWLDIYVGEGKTERKKWNSLNTAGRHVYTLYRRTEPGEECRRIR